MKKEVMHNMSDEMIKVFYGVNFREFESREAKRIIQDITDKNEKLTKEKIQLNMEIRRLKNNLNKRSTITYEAILKNFESRFFYSSVHSIKSLATGEYLFLNEGNTIDYSGVFLNYLKGLEIEIRNRLDESNKMTFGKLLNKLKHIPELKSFINALEKLDILEIRNKGVHNKVISKLECGKLRKLLLEDRWFDRVNQILNEIENDKNILVDKSVYIYDLEGTEIYEGKKYLCFSTKEGIYILSENDLSLGIENIKGKVINIYGIDYIVIKNPII